MRNYLRIAIFCSFIGLVTALTYKFLRAGLDDNSYWDICKIVGSLFFLLFTPLLIHTWASKREKSNYYYHPSIILLLLIMVVEAISIVDLDIPIVWFFSSIGWIQFTFYFFHFIKGSTLIEYLVGLPITLMAAFTNAGYIYCNLAKPHLFEALVAQHLPYNWPTDTLFHSSIVQMINSYGVASTGLDGIPYIDYHVGSHYVFFPIVNFLSIDPLKFYTLACPVIFSSLFFFIFFHTIIQINVFLQRERKFVNLGYVFWIFFFGIFFGFVKRSFIWHNGLQLWVPGVVGNSAIMVSESYLLSIILCLIVFTILLLKAQEKTEPSKDYFLYLFVLPVFLFVVTIIKVSTGFILFAVFGYLFLRYNLYRKLLFNLSLLIGVILWFLAYQLVTEPNSQDSTVTFEFFKVNNISFIIGFLAIHYFWTYLLIVFYVIKDTISFSIFKSEKLTNILIQLNPVSTLLDSIKQRKTIFGELALVVALAGFAPIAILSLDVNGGFFSEVQYFFSAIILLAYISTIDSSVLMNKTAPIAKKLMLTISFILFSYIFFSNTKHFMVDMLDSNFLFRKTIVGDYSYTKPRVKLVKLIENGKFESADSLLNVYGRRVQLKLDSLKEYAFLKKLRALNNLPHSEKMKSMIYIDYRHAGLKMYIPCHDMVMLAPALSGVVQLNGLYASDNCTYLDGWRFNYYKIRSKAEGEKILTDQELCAMATANGFKQVIIYRPEINDFVTIQCKN